MAFKYVALFALVAVASAQYHHSDYHHPAPVVHHSAPVYHAAPVVKHIAQPVYKHVEYEHEAPAKYDFEYSVHDEHTGDIKSQKESRDGDVVHGSYSLLDADGHQRTVEYTADDHNGFNAVVHREPTGHAPVVHKVVAAAPVYHAAPVVAKVVAPVAHYSHAAPVAHYSHAAPVAHYSAPAPVAHYSHQAPVAHYSAPAHHNYHY